MGVTSTVSRAPITVKVLPMSSSEEDGGREQQQQQGELEEEGSQHQNSQTQREAEAAEEGNIFVIPLTDTVPLNQCHCL